MNNLECQHLNTIYAGSKVFDKLSEVSPIIKNEGRSHTYIHGIRIVKSEMLEGNSMVTLDPRMVKILKEMEAEG